MPRAVVENYVAVLGIVEVGGIQLAEKVKCFLIVLVVVAVWIVAVYARVLADGIEITRQFVDRTLPP